MQQKRLDSTWKWTHWRQLSLARRVECLMVHTMLSSKWLLTMFAKTTLTNKNASCAQPKLDYMHHFDFAHSFIIFATFLLRLLRHCEIQNSLIDNTHLHKPRRVYYDLMWLNWLCECKNIIIQMGFLRRLFYISFLVANCVVLLPPSKPIFI